MTNRAPIAVIGGLALVLAWVLAPRPSTSGPQSPRGPVVRPMSAVLSMNEAPVSIRPLVIGGRRFGSAPRASMVPEIRFTTSPDESDDAGDRPIATGFLTGHVVDEQGLPVKQAVVHLHGPEGTLAHRVREDGTFHIAVPEGSWTAEAGWFDGEDEWRSKPATSQVTAGESTSVPLEILMGGAAHGVLASIKEEIGVGWEVEEDDGPLKAGDLLVEVDGRVLADLQPESVKAALRSRPGESIPAVVLRRDDGGDYEEVTVALDAR